jgi:hypothetical protein
MRTPHHAVTSAGRFSAWLVAFLGLGAYVGLIYGLTVFPLQLELPVPYWATFAVPAAVYGLLILLFVRRPTILRWIVGTALLSGLHVALVMAREPLSVMLDPALAGRPLPWMLPPPFPELVGVFLLLVPLRDLLRARPRLARERIGSIRASSSVRARGSVVPRVPQTAPSERVDSPKDLPIWERSEPTEPAEAPAAMPAPIPVAPLEPARIPPRADEPSRRAAARTERQPETVRKPLRRSDVVLRIALDRIVGQLPPGTFLAPEDEVAASLRDRGHLLIPGELVVTQLSEGVARIAWSDVVDQFPAHLVGLSPEEISEHLGEGLRLPLDEVVGQLPHELFVADTPEVDIAGLDRIPVPFHPMEDSTPAPSLSRAAAAEGPSAPVMQQPPPGPAPVAYEPPVAAETGPAVAEARSGAPAPSTPVVPAPAAPARAEVPPSSPPGRVPEPSVATSTSSSPTAEGPTVRISFARVVSELPTDVFNVSLDQVAGRMRQPGALLIPQSLVLSQLAEGLIRATWDVVASQFPRETLTVSDADMMARLPGGITLPLDEVICQIPPDLFAIGGSAVDLHGLESFPAPFQPLVSDPEPQSPMQVAAEPRVVTPPTPREAPSAPTGMTDVLAEGPPIPEPPALEPPAREEGAPQLIVSETTPVDVSSGLEAPVITSEPVSESVSITDPERSESRALEPAVLPPPAEPVVSPAPVLPVSQTPEPSVVVELDRAERGWPDNDSPAAAVAVPVARMAETTEIRRIAATLAPIASFDTSVHSVEGVTVFAMAAPSVAPEIAVAGAGLALPLFTERHGPWSFDQITFRGPEIALVLTAIGAPSDRGAVLATAVPRGGGLTLLEILCRRAAGDHSHGAVSDSTDGLSARRSLAPLSAEKVARITTSLTAFGDLAASALRDAGGEGLLYLFLPTDTDVVGVGALAQGVQAVMRKAAGSGSVFRTAVLRSGRSLLVIQPEEVAHGRSIIVVAGGEVSRPGLAYRQVERVTAALAQA